MINNALMAGQIQCRFKGASYNYIAAMIKGVVVTILVSVMLTTVAGQCEDDENYKQYLEWKQKFAENFQDGEDVFRAIIYKKNKEHIRKNNQNKDSSYTEGENKFMGLTKEEFKATYLLVVPPDHKTAKIEVVDDQNDELSAGGNNDIKVNAIATSIDWRSNNGVTPVRDQAACGSCWAFAAVAAIESSYLIKNKVALDLSEQQLVSCSDIYGNGGCNGGWPASALKYPLNYGMTTEAAYPYVARTGTCAQTGGDFKIRRILNTAYGRCGALRNQLQRRPVSVALDASDWGYYQSGVFKCNEQVDINHAVLLVGYDANKNWIIKNSWGTWWGDKGYMTIHRNTRFNCGICVYGATAAIV